MKTILPPDEVHRLRSIGAAAFKREIAEEKHCQPTSPYRDAAEALLRSMEAEEAEASAQASKERNALLDRRDSMAMRMAVWANVIAILAIAIAMKDELLTLFGFKP